MTGTTYIKQEIPQEHGNFLDIATPRVSNVGAPTAAPTHPRIVAQPQLSRSNVVVYTIPRTATSLLGAGSAVMVNFIKLWSQDGILGRYTVLVAGRNIHSPKSPSVEMFIVSRKNVYNIILYILWFKINRSSPCVFIQIARFLKCFFILNFYTGV